MALKIELQCHAVVFSLLIVVEYFTAQNFLCDFETFSVFCFNSLHTDNHMLVYTEIDVPSFTNYKSLYMRGINQAKSSSLVRRTRPHASLSDEKSAKSLIARQERLRSEDSKRYDERDEIAAERVTNRIKILDRLKSCSCGLSSCSPTACSKLTNLCRALEKLAVVWTWWGITRLTIHLAFLRRGKCDRLSKFLLYEVHTLDGTIVRVNIVWGRRYCVKLEERRGMKRNCAELVTLVCSWLVTTSLSRFPPHAQSSAPFLRGTFVI